MALMASAIDDLKDERVPPSLYWTVDQVADWIEELGFPDYRVNHLKRASKLIHSNVVYN